MLKKRCLAHVKKSLAQTLALSFEPSKEHETTETRIIISFVSVCLYEQQLKLDLSWNTRNAEF